MDQIIVGGDMRANLVSMMNSAAFECRMNLFAIGAFFD